LLDVYSIHSVRIARVVDGRCEGKVRRQGKLSAGIFRLVYDIMRYQSKRYCPVLVAQEGSALWRNTLATALLHDPNRAIPFGLIAPSPSQRIGNLKNTPWRTLAYLALDRGP